MSRLEILFEEVYPFIQSNGYKINEHREFNYLVLIATIYINNNSHGFQIIYKNPNEKTEHLNIMFFKNGLSPKDTGAKLLTIANITIIDKNQESINSMNKYIKNKLIKKLIF